MLTGKARALPARGRGCRLRVQAQTAANARSLNSLLVDYSSKISRFIPMAKKQSVQCLYITAGVKNILGHLQSYYIHHIR